MPRYSEGFKEQAIQKMMPPNAVTVVQISRDFGVAKQTLYNWRNRISQGRKAVPADPMDPKNRSGKVSSPL